MELYDLKEIMSGEDEHCLWVTLGFSSDLEGLDVLHIVCGKSVEDQDLENGTDGIYLERFDQAYSGYKGADSIRVSPSEITVELNSEGQKELDFKGAVSFRVTEGLKGSGDAYLILAKMLRYAYGQIVELAQQDGCT